MILKNLKKTIIENSKILIVYFREFQNELCKQLLFEKLIEHI